MKKNELNIFDFRDFRDFLLAFAEKQRSCRGTWSYAGWSKHLGLAGTASLTMVLNGTRNPGRIMIERFVKYFEFNANEAEYFNDLIKLNRFKDDPRLSIMLMERMEVKYPNKKHTFIDIEKFQAISNWYYYAIREMANLKEFSPNPIWIAERLAHKVSHQDIKKALRILTQLGLISKDAAGKTRPSGGIISTPADVASEAVKEFQESMCDHARSALRKVPLHLREFGSATFTLQTEKMPLAKELVRKFIDDLEQLMEQPGGDATYHLNVHFFPMTRVSAASGEFQP